MNSGVQMGLFPGLRPVLGDTPVPGTLVRVLVLLLEESAGRARVVGDAGRQAASRGDAEMRRPSATSETSLCGHS